MINERSNGIVLKTYFSHKTKLMIFDHRLGKIACVPPHQSLSIGTHLEYVITQRGSAFFLSNVLLHDMPLLIAREDILFLHYIVELCYHGVPLSGPMPELFALVLQLFNQSQGRYTAGYKMAFVFKMFVLLGIYPEDPSLRASHFYHLAHMPIDTLVEKALDLKMDMVLYEWVCSSIATHPLIGAFNTAHFIQTIGYEQCHVK